MTPFRLAGAERDGLRDNLKFGAFAGIAIAGPPRPSSFEPPQIFGETDA